MHVCAAETNKQEYKLESDIINFDYNEIGYPIIEPKIGVYPTIVSTNTPPRKIVRSEEPQDDLAYLKAICIGSVLGLFIASICAVAVCLVFMSTSIILEYNYMKKNKE
jgi:hypothetical protein